MGMSRQNKQAQMHWGTLSAAAKAAGGNPAATQEAKKKKPDVSREESKREEMIKKFEDKDDEAARRKAKAAKEAAVAGPKETVNFNFLSQAATQGAVQSRMSSFFLGERGGAVVLGGIDPKFHIGEIQYHPALQKVSGSWALEIKSMQVGGHEVCGKTPCIALIDSGTTAMVVPSVSAMQIMGGSDAKGCSGVAKFTVGDQDLVLDHDQWCGRIKPSGKRIHDQLAGLSDDDSLQDRTWLILGEAFMKGFYTVFDNRNTDAPRVGFAPVCKQSQVMCVGKAHLCHSDERVRARCPIACGLCGNDKTQELEEAQFEP